MLDGVAATMRTYCRIVIDGPAQALGSGIVATVTIWGCRLGIDEDGT